MASYVWDPVTGTYALSDDAAFITSTDQPDYTPGQTVQITATFDAGSTVQFMVAHDIGAGADGIWGTADDVLTYDLTGTGQSWDVTADANGQITTSWLVNDDALGQNFELVAVEQAADGTFTGAMTMSFFTDGNPPPTPTVFAYSDTHIDLTTKGTTTTSDSLILANVGTALVSQATSGTGNFGTFVEVQATPTEDGFNTTDNTVLDTKNSNQFNTAIKLSDLQLVNSDGSAATTVGAGTYYEFKLDLHQANSKPFISLDGLQFWQSNTANLDSSTFSDGTKPDGSPDFHFNAGSATLAYDYGGNGEKSILLDSLFSAGSGGGTDLVVLVDATKFDPGQTYVYLYSAFGYQGGDWSANSTFEEWGALLKSTVNPPPPTPHAALSIDKEIFCDDGDNVTGGIVLASSTIDFTYTLTDVGDNGSSVKDVALTDSVLGTIYANGAIDPTLAANHTVTFDGDTNGNGQIDFGENWVITVSDVAVKGPYTNVGEVTGTDVNGNGALVQDSLPATYFGADPEITIDKVTTGNTDATHTTTGDNISILAGYGVGWTYTVHNSGNVDLSDIVVSDDQLGVVYDATHTSSLQAADTVAGTGDLNHNGILDQGETWIFKASGTAILGSYANNATVTADTSIDGNTVKTDACGDSLSTSAHDGSSYTGTFTEQGGTLTQGFWGSHTDAWDGTLGHESNPTKSAFGSGVLSALDINPRHDGTLLLGDANGNGKADDAHDLLMTDKLAAAIESSSTNGDARIIMLQQAIATQLNIDNGKAEPNNLIDEAVMWLTKAPGSAWAGVGVNIAQASTINDGFGNQTLVVAENGAHSALLGSSVSTSSAAWHTYVDVTDPSSGIADWNGGKEADGEGLKNALMWWNDGHLVTSAAGQVAYDTNGTAAGGINPATVNLNTLDEFWLTLHQQTGLTGIA